MGERSGAPGIGMRNNKESDPLTAGPGQSRHYPASAAAGANGIFKPPSGTVPYVSHAAHAQQRYGPHHLSFERKCLLAATSATVIGFILMLVAVTTDYWLIVTNPGGAYLHQDKLWRMASHSGIWRICNIDFRNNTQPYRIDTHCQRHILFPSEDEASKHRLDFDRTSLDYTRSEVAFSTISLILMFIGQGFAFYSFKERRYMFKRLTGFLHFLSASCVFICIEVLHSSVAYEQANLPSRHPAQALSHFGFSFVLACVTCAAYFVAGFTFLIFSRKRKPKKPTTEMRNMDEEDIEQAEADAPMRLGR